MFNILSRSEEAQVRCDKKLFHQYFDVLCTSLIVHVLLITDFSFNCLLLLRKKYYAAIFPKNKCYCVEDMKDQKYLNPLKECSAYCSKYNDNKCGIEWYRIKSPCIAGSLIFLNCLIIMHSMFSQVENVILMFAICQIVTVSFVVPKNWS